MFNKKKSEPVQNRIRPQVERQKTKTFSYYANRAPVEATDRKRSRGKLLPNIMADRIQRGTMTRSQKIYMTIGSMVFLALLAYNSLLSASPNLTVVGKTEDRLLLQNEVVYKNAATEELKSSLLNRTKLTIDNSVIEGKLLKKYPELAAVDLSLPLFGHTPVLQLVPAKAAAIFVSSDGASYILAEDGRIISTASGDAAKGLTTITDQSGLSAQLGSLVLPADDVTFITRLLHQLTQKNQAVNSVTLPAAGREVDIRLEGKPYFVKFSFAHDVLQQAGAFDAVRAQLEAGKLAPAQYIDVRVGDRVYYK